jgi:LysR family transcriptional regulator for metE and metH
MHIEIKHLQLVEAVAEHGSLTRAGERLHLTQSALSHQLREIEERLGTSLFLRLNKRMVLTPAGERLLDSARQVLGRLVETERNIRALATERQGVIRLTTECYTCYHWLPPLLRTFQRRFPRVEVRIDVESTPRPLPPLLDGRLDLAIVSCRVRDRRLVMRPLFQDELVVIVHPEHPLGRLPYVRPADLAPENLIIYAPKEESTLFNRILTPAGVSPAGLQQVQLTEAIVELVKAGLGVSALARWAVQPHLEAGTLKAVSLTRGGFIRHWQAAVLKSVAKLPYVVDFLDLLATDTPRLLFRARRPITAGSSGRIAARS